MSRCARGGMLVSPGWTFRQISLPGWGRRWVSLSYDGKIMTGWEGMARSEAEARGVIDQLKTQAGGTRD